VLNTTVKSVVFWVAMIVLVALVWNFSSRFQRNELPVTFSEFISWVDSGQVATVTITGSELTGQTHAKELFRTTLPAQYDGLVNRLIEKKVIVQAKEPTASPWAALLLSWAPILLLIGFWIFFMRQVQSGGNKALSFGKSKAKLSSSAQKKVPFRDIFRDRFWITTSGNFSTPALWCCIMEMGVDHILFSVDWPMVDNKPGTDWMAGLDISHEDKAKILGGNAARLLRL